jgi:hypothetical protein
VTGDVYVTGGESTRSLPLPESLRTVTTGSSDGAGTHPCGFSSLLSDVRHGPFEPTRLTELEQLEFAGKVLDFASPAWRSWPFQRLSGTG